MNMGMKPKTEPKGNIISWLISSFSFSKKVTTTADASIPSHDAIPDTITIPIIVRKLGRMSMLLIPSSGIILSRIIVRKIRTIPPIINIVNEFALPSSGINAPMIEKTSIIIRRIITLPGTLIINSHGKDHAASFRPNKMIGKSVQTEMKTPNDWNNGCKSIARQPPFVISSLDLFSVNATTIIGKNDMIRYIIAVTYVCQCSRTFKPLITASKNISVSFNAELSDEYH
jgi:hypothetical protein